MYTLGDTEICGLHWKKDRKKVPLASAIINVESSSFGEIVRGHVLNQYAVQGSQESAALLNNSNLDGLNFRSANAIRQTDILFVSQNHIFIADDLLRRYISVILLAVQGSQESAASCECVAAN